jgi:hypothetical protein
LELLKTVNKKLEEGLNPKISIRGQPLCVLTVKQGRFDALTVEEVRDTMDAAFRLSSLRDPDHLYVPGRVIHSDLWSKQGAQISG